MAKIAYDLDALTKQEFLSLLRQGYIYMDGRIIAVPRGGAVITAAGGIANTVSSSFITSNVVLTANAATTITSLSLGAGTWALLGTALIAGSGTAGTVYIGFSPTTNSFTSGYSTTQMSDYIAGDFNMPVCFASIVLSSTTTVYLVIETSDSTGGTVYANPGVGVAAKASGMIAIQIA